MPSNNLLTTLQITFETMAHNLPLVIALIVGLWLINFVNWLVKYRLNILGIYPRTWHGLIGIIFCPILHGDFNHVFFNSIPLFILINLVLLQGLNYFVCASLVIVLLGGFGVWCFGRRAIHIGASGLIMGYFGYILFNAYYQHTLIAIILGLICIYYLGGLLIYLFPSKEKMSWEGHVFGFFAGFSATLLCPILHGYHSF